MANPIQNQPFKIYYPVVENSSRMQNFPAYICSDLVPDSSGLKGKSGEIPALSP